MFSYLLYIIFFIWKSASTQLYPLSLHDALPISQRYRVEGLSFRWRSLALLGRTVSIHSLRADAVYLVLPQGDDEPEDVPAEPISDWPNLSLPIRIRLANVDLNNLHIQQGETVTQVQRISGTLKIGRAHV